MTTPIAAKLGRRNVLAALGMFTGGAFTGVAAVTVPQALASPSPAAATCAALPTPAMRTATVLAAPPPTAATVSVKLDGDGQQLTLPYVSPYVPVPGESVQVQITGAGQDLKGLVLGGQSGKAGNLVLNGDFARIPQLQTKQPPHNWYHHRVSGGAMLLGSIVAPRYQKPMMVLSSFPDTSGDHYAYSAAIEVKAGDSLKVDSAVYLDVVGPVTVTVQLRVAWFKEVGAVYPKQIAESTLQTLEHTIDGEYLYSGTAKAPAAAVAARCAIRVAHRGEPESQYTLYVGHVQATR